MSDQEVRLESLLSQLEGSHISIADAARAVRAMTFTAVPRRTPQQSQEDADLPELDVPDPDSFFAVSQAYTSGRITRRQYEALQQAAADSIRARAKEPGHEQEAERLEHGDAFPGTHPGGQHHSQGQG